MNTKENQVATNQLIGKCAVYLNDNFHKFSQANKIKIALDILKKSMPTELSGEVKTGQTLVLVIPQERSEEYGNRLNGAIIPSGS